MARVAQGFAAEEIEESLASHNKAVMRTSMMVLLGCPRQSATDTKSPDKHGDSTLLPS